MDPYCNRAAAVTAVAAADSVYESLDADRPGAVRTGKSFRDQPKNACRQRMIVYNCVQIIGKIRKYFRDSF